MESLAPCYGNVEAPRFIREESQVKMWMMVSVPVEMSIALFSRVGVPQGYIADAAGRYSH